MTAIWVTINAAPTTTGEKKAWLMISSSVFSREREWPTGVTIVKVRLGLR